MPWFLLLVTVYNVQPRKVLRDQAQDEQDMGEQSEASERTIFEYAPGNYNYLDEHENYRRYYLGTKMETVGDIIWTKLRIFNDMI